MANLRNYTLKIKPSERYQFGLRGNVVRVISAKVPVFFSTGNRENEFYLSEGEQAKLTDGSNFLTLDIYHEHAEDQTIILAVSEGAEIGSTKISGLVSLSDSTMEGLSGQNQLMLDAMTAQNQQILAALAALTALQSSGGGSSGSSVVSRSGHQENGLCLLQAAENVSGFTIVSLKLVGRRFIALPMSNTVDTYDYLSIVIRDGTGMQVQGYTANSQYDYNTGDSSGNMGVGFMQYIEVPAGHGIFIPTAGYNNVPETSYRLEGILH